MNTAPLNAQIQTAIDTLYHAAEIVRPTADTPIIPLGELVRNQNVTCTELVNLSMQTAMNYLLKRGGLAEPLENPSADPLAGFLYANSHFGSIFVEKTDLVTRRRFSIAHELGHYLLHFQPLLATTMNDQDSFLEAFEAFPKIDPDVEPDALPTGQLTLFGTQDRTYRSIEQMEREANQFAVDLLMPMSVVRALAERYEPRFRGEDLVWRLASEMLVSGAAMRWRLRELGLLIPLNVTLN